jgi:hypothetical protein
LAISFLTALHEIWALNLFYSHMKTSLLFGPAFAILGMAAASEPSGTPQSPQEQE